MVTLQILVLPFLVRVRVAQQRKGIHRKMDPFFIYENENDNDNEDEDCLEFQRFNTAAMPMVMRQFISMQGWSLPSDVTSISTPTGPSYHGAI